MEHQESDFIQVKAAKKRPASATSEATADARDGEPVDQDLGPAQAVAKKSRRAAAEKQKTAQTSIFYDDAMEARCEFPP